MGVATDQTTHFRMSPDTASLALAEHLTASGRRPSVRIQATPL